MRVVIAAIAFTFLGSICASAQSGAQSIFDQIRPSIVSVTAYDDDGEVISRGIGLVVSANGDIITHKRVIESVSRAEIKTHDGRLYSVNKLISKDTSSEMVLFSVNMPKEFASPVKISQTIPKIGETIAVVSLDESSEPVLIKGVVSNIKPYSLWKNLQIKASLPSGSLGSPIFNPKGEFTGMVSFQTYGEDFFIAIAGERLPDMIGNLLNARTSGSIKMDDKPTGSLSTEGIQRIGGILQGKAIKRVSPIYPITARDAGISGSVIVEVMVDEKGNVIRAEAKPSSFERPRTMSDEQARAVIPHLQKAAVEAARKWKFKPTTLYGSPVKVIGTITFNFRM